MRTRWLRVTTGVVDVFAGGMAVAGAVGLVGGGIQFPLEWLRGTPFTDYTWPGLILGVVVGGSALVAAAITFLARPQAGALATGAASAVLLGWILGEYVLVGSVSWMQPTTLVYSLVMLGLAGTLELAATHQPRLPHTRHGAPLRGAA